MFQFFSFQNVADKLQLIMPLIKLYLCLSLFQDISSLDIMKQGTVPMPLWHMRNMATDQHFLDQQLLLDDVLSVTAFGLHARKFFWSHFITIGQLSVMSYENILLYEGV